jgi:hypothetical protein
MTNLPPPPEGMKWVRVGPDSAHDPRRLPPPPEGMKWVWVGDDPSPVPSTNEPVGRIPAAGPGRSAPVSKSLILIVDLAILLVILWLAHFL